MRVVENWLQKKKKNDKSKKETSIGRSTLLIACASLAINHNQRSQNKKKLLCILWKILHLI
jgi:hypothetical protein